MLQETSNYIFLTQGGATLGLQLNHRKETTSWLPSQVEFNEGHQVSTPGKIIMLKEEGWDLCEDQTKKVNKIATHTEKTQILLPLIYLCWMLFLYYYYYFC